MNKKTVLRHLRHHIESIGVRTIILREDTMASTLYYYQIKVENKKIFVSPHYDNIESCYIAGTREHYRMVQCLYDTELYYGSYTEAIDLFKNGYKRSYYVPN